MTSADSSLPDTDKPLRADARRNRARLLDAAETVFAAEGASASTEEIARRAGVGIGTLFRHFPTKEALLEAIVLARLRQLADEVDALIVTGDPGSAFFAFFALAAKQAEEKRAFTELLGGLVDITAADPELRRRIRAGIETLLVHAQGVGTVHGEVRLPEVLALLVGAGRVAEYTGGDRALRDRVLEIILDGLRPAGPR